MVETHIPAKLRPILPSGGNMKQQLSQGLSLLEMIVSIAIIGGITIVLSQAFFTTTRGSVKIDLQSEIKQSGDFAMRSLENLIRSSESITSSCTGNPSRQLDVKNPNGTTFSLQCAFDSENNVTRIASVSATGTQYLTGGNVSLGGSDCLEAAMSLWFTCSKPEGQPTSILVSFSLSQKGMPQSSFEAGNQSFHTTINGRN
jgi:hypothetical protein